jgi:hypothetical protein
VVKRTFQLARLINQSQSIKTSIHI